MNKADAEKLARFLGLKAEHTGGGIYCVQLPLPNGMTIMLGEDSWGVETEEDTFVPVEIIQDWEG